MQKIKYQITLQPQQHCYIITLSFFSSSNLCSLSLPTWIPGSYMIREFSRNIIQLSATANGVECQFTQQNKNTWVAEHDDLLNASIVISYKIYAFELGIRSAYLDDQRGYFNPSSLCLLVEGYQEQAQQIIIENLPNTWQVACGLTTDTSVTQFTAKSYDELLDMPFELGNFQCHQFNLLGITHRLIISGTYPQFDLKRLIKDIQTICLYQINLFANQLPYTNYTFILHIGGEICTGLEHRNSTLLMAPYYVLPNLQASNNSDYHKLLGLISHEFFHTWNVKQIKPQAFIPYNLQQENYTKLLWWFEGVTSYYDDLVLYRSGIISQEEYLKLVIQNINNVYKFAGVKQQSVANSSLTSWIKYYRQDENSPNSIVSYYVKGALIALALDLLIRDQSQFSLDDVMRYLYQNYLATGQGIGEEQIAELIYASTKVDLKEFIYLATETCQDLPLSELFLKVGLQLVPQLATNHQQQGSYFANQEPFKTHLNQVVYLGIKGEQQALGYLIKNIYNNSLAHNQGLAVGDILIAIDNIKITNLERQLSFYQLGSKIKLTLFRQECLLNYDLTLTANTVQVYNLQLISNKLLAN
ncbi:MAG: hypothetical protein RLZZ293_881, partial [Pseudomonadota bacterium]